MNVAGISTAPPPVVLPAITAVQPGQQTETRTKSDRQRDEKREDEPGAIKLPDPPKWKPLSLDEFHVMLGMASPSVLLKTEKKYGREAFDAWA